MLAVGSMSLWSIGHRVDTEEIIGQWGIEIGSVLGISQAIYGDGHFVRLSKGRFPGHFPDPTLLETRNQKQEALA